MYDKATTIIRVESMESGISVELLTKKGKTKNIAAAKKKIRARLRLETDLSWREINELMGFSKTHHR